MKSIEKHARKQEPRSKLGEEFYDLQMLTDDELEDELDALVSILDLQLGDSYEDDPPHIQMLGRFVKTVAMSLIIVLDRVREKPAAPAKRVPVGRKTKPMPTPLHKGATT